jgi:hypothetical protein
MADKELTEDEEGIIVLVRTELQVFLKAQDASIADLATVLAILSVIQVDQRV